MNTLMKVRMLGGDSERGRERGREYQDTERPRAGYYSGEYEPMEARFRDSEGRERYDNGRFAPMRAAYEPPYMGNDEEEYRRKWTIIENRNAPMRSQGDWSAPQYRGETNEDGMRRIYGFGMGGGRGMEANYRGPSHEAEMGWRSGHAERGYSQSEAVPPMTREMAEEWMASIKNEDGTVGPHWTLEQVKQLMQQRGINNVDPVRVWVAMNADYSDRVVVNRKHGIDKPDYYLDSALAAWINDKDAVPHKESAYYRYIVKR